ncbi:MAG: hypothetical protein HYV40_06790 [Candidatus Levybacteria bacterium]|nr:hypothetical protein [Candidatus Levybacteria bacterium]
MTGRKRHRVKPLHLLLSVLLLILTVGGTIIFAKTYKPPLPETYIERGNTYLEELAGELGVDAQIQETIYWDWIDEKNTLLPLIGNQFIIGTVDANGIGKYGKVTSDNLEKINSKFFRPIINTSEDFFTMELFVEDKKNRRDSENNPLNETFRGFTRGKVLCVLRLTTQSDPFGYFFCGIVDEKQRKLQQQFTSLFSTKYNPKNFSSFRVETVEGDFASGSYSESVIGYVWFAKKENGEWNILWKGNDIALCSDMETLQIPKRIYQNCYKE